MKLFLSSGIMKYSNSGIDIIFNIYLLSLPVVFFILLPDYFSKFTGYWFGLNAFFILTAGYKTPKFTEGIQKRILSVITAGIIFSLIEIIIKFLVTESGLADINIGLFIRGTIVSFAGIILTLNINRKLKLNK
jgi:hypothetical protein